MEDGFRTEQYVVCNNRSLVRTIMKKSWKVKVGLYENDKHIRNSMITTIIQTMFALLFVSLYTVIIELRLLLTALHSVICYITSLIPNNKL